MFRLVTFENNKFEVIENLSQNRFNGLMKDSKTLYKIFTQFEVFKYLQLNVKEFNDFVHRSSNIPVIKLDIKELTNPDVLLEVNKIVLNLISSFYFYIENSKTYLKREFGSDSVIDKQYADLRKKHYDNSFAYHFLTKLRHYSLHIGFPLKGLGFSAEKNEDYPEKMIGHIDILIDIEIIKKEKETFRGSFYEEIILKDEDIDLKPLVTNLSYSIFDLQKFIYSSQKEIIEEAIGNIEDYAARYKTESNDIKLQYNFKEDVKMVEFTPFHIPFEIITDLKHFITSIRKFS